MRTALIVVATLSLAGCGMFGGSTPPPSPMAQHTASPPPAPVIDSTQSPRGISDAQTVLAREGFYKGKIDGHWGPATESALRSYQQAHNLPVTGKLNDDTWAALNTKPQ